MRLGQAGIGLKELIATLVVSGILIIVGVVVFSKVKTSMVGSGSDLGVSANNTINAVESTAYDAFKLATIALIVLASAVIIGILIRAFGA
jgi:hypothetical protein